MAHFYGSTRGNRGIMGKCGTKKSGYKGHLRGWNIGGEIYLYHQEDKNRDVINITLTKGSNNHNDKIPKIEIFATEDGKYTVRINDKIIKSNEK